MKSVAATLFLATSLLSAQALNITFPNSQQWWVGGNSINKIEWTCQAADTHPLYTASVFHPTLLPKQEGLAIQSVLTNTDCSEQVNPLQLTPATGYTIALADTANRSHIYTVSEPFEVKAEGSLYPASTLSGTASATATDSSSASGASASSTSASASAASASASNAPSSASAISVAARGVFAVTGLAAGLVYLA